MKSLPPLWAAKKTDDPGYTAGMEPTDVGTTPRQTMSTTRRLKIFEGCKGLCILCGTKIKPGDAWTIEHIVPLGLGGPDNDGNCAPAHETCRRIKDKADVAAIAKAKRRKAKHYGAIKKTSRPIPGSKASGWRKPMNGPPERRK